MKKYLSILIILISGFSHAECRTICDEKISRQVLIKSMNEIADKWDYRSNVCQQIFFHQIADAYREISVAHEVVSTVCDNASDYVAEAIINLRMAQRKLDELELIDDSEFQDANCPPFDFFLTSSDAGEG